MSERVPEIRNQSLNDLVELATGAKMEVWAIDPRCGDEALRSDNHIIDGVIEDVFTKAKIDGDRSLELVCAAVARASVRRIFNMPLVRIYYGEHFAPSSVVEVELRSVNPDFKKVTAFETPPEVSEQ